MTAEVTDARRIVLLEATAEARTLIEDLQRASRAAWNFTGWT